jgi:predicted Fe-Mo cluster-binding NifX family protein
MSTKIAIVTEDGVNVSAHFGRAPYFQVLTIENGQIIARERRAKGFHGQHEHEHNQHHHNHNDMLSAASDCAAIIAGGMGSPAYASIQAANITPILTDVRDIEQAAQAYIAGTLVNRLERIHRH